MLELTWSVTKELKKLKLQNVKNIYYQVQHKSGEFQYSRVWH